LDSNSDKIKRREIGRFVGEKEFDNEKWVASIKRKETKILKKNEKRCKKQEKYREKFCDRFLDS